MNFTKLFISVFIFLLTVKAFPQERHLFRYIGVNDGIPSGAGGNSIVQDSIGFIWFSTLGGVAKYDGYKVKEYKFFIDGIDTINLPEVTTIFLDQDNILWLGGFNQIAYYDRDKDIFYSNYLTEEKKEAKNPTYIYTIQEGKDDLLWLASDVNGIFSFSKITKEIKHFKHEPDNPKSLSSDTLSGFIIDNSGNLWMSTFTKGICKYEPDKNLFSVFNQSNSKIPANSVTALHKENNGKIWIGARHGFLTELNPETNYFITYPVKLESERSYVISQLLTDDNEYVWIATYRDGLIRLNKNSKEFTSVNKIINDNNPEFNYTWSLFKDRTGLVWAGGLEEFNIYSPRRQTFEVLSNRKSYIKNANNALVNSVAEDKKGNIWLGTTNGLFKIDTEDNYTHFFKSKTNIKLPNQTGDNSISKLFISNTGDLWISIYWGSLIKFIPETGKYTEYKNIPGDSTSLSEGFAENGLIQDSFGDIWMSKSNSISKLDTSTGKFKHYMIKTIRFFYEDSEKILWACSGSNGLYKYDRKKDEFSEYFNESSFHGFSMTAEDNQKRLWVSSFYNGIHLFDRHTGNNVSISHKDGLQSDFINNLIKDNSGMLWLGSRIGLTRFDPDSRFIKNFNTEDGLEIKNFWTTSAFKDSRGKLYFSGKEGLVSFYPAPLNMHIPNIALTDFKIHDHPISPSDTSALKKNINVAKEIELDHDQNSISIEFAALDYTDPKRNLYAYKLEGFDNDWIYSGTERLAKYNNLDPGHYVFTAKGTNDDGIWNEEGTSLMIIIHPPWWKTWWFTSAWILVAATTFGGTIRYVSVQKLKRKLREMEQQQMIEKERARISKDMHDEVGSSLTRITLLSEIAKNKIGELDEIKKISEASREVVNNMDEIVWAVNPKNDSLENLSAYVQQFAQNFFDASEITCRFEFPPMIPAIPLASDIRHNIFLTIKESLNNILKHSNSTEAVIKLNIEKDHFEFCISDNGAGMNLENIDRFSNGLTIMKQRIESLNGIISINSQKGSGTKITFRIPLKK